MSDTNKKVGFTITVDAAQADKAIQAVHETTKRLGEGMLQVASVSTGALKSTEKGVSDLETVTIKVTGTIKKGMKELATVLQQVDADLTTKLGSSNAEVIKRLGEDWLKYSTKVVDAHKSIDAVVTGTFKAEVNAERQAREALIEGYKQTVSEFKRAEDIKVNESGTTASKIKAIKQKQADELLKIERELTAKILAEQEKIEGYKERLQSATGRSAGGYRGLITSATNRISDSLSSAGTNSTSVIQSSTAQIQALQAASANGTGNAAQLRTALNSYRISLQDHINATRQDVGRMLNEAREGFTATAQQSRTIESSLTAMRAQFRAVAAVIRDDLTRGVIGLTEAERQLNVAQQEWTENARRSTSAFREMLETSNSGTLNLFNFIGRLNLAWRATNFAIETVLSGLKSIPNALIDFQSTFSALEGSFTINPSDPAGMNSLAFATTAAGNAMDYLKQEAQRTGIPIKVLEEYYRSFLASTRIAGESLTTTNRIFENINTTVTALHLSADNAKNTFLALSQMFNKGKVQSEELVKQLGNLLPGAFAAFASATNRSTEQLVRDMKAGTVRAHDDMLKFSEFYAKYYSEAFESASVGLNASLGRLSSAWEYTARDMGLLWQEPMVGLVKFAESALNIYDAQVKRLIGYKDMLLNAFGIAGAGAAGELSLLKKQQEFISQNANNQNRAGVGVGGSLGVPAYRDEAGRMEALATTMDKIAKLEQTILAVKAQENVEGKITEASEQNRLDLQHRYYKEAQAYNDQIAKIARFKEDNASADPIRQAEVDKQVAEYLSQEAEILLKHTNKQLKAEEAINARLDKQIEKRNTLLEQVRSEREKFDAAQAADEVAAGITGSLSPYEASDKIKSNLQEIKAIFDSLNISQEDFNKKLNESSAASKAVSVNLSEVTKGNHFSQSKFDSAVRAINNPANREMIALIERVAEQTKFDPDILKAVGAVESGFKANANSGKALGLFQFTPSTAAGYGVKDRLNPEQSALGAVKYLTENLKNFKGDLAKALNQYNGGGKTGLNQNAESLTYQDTLLPLIKHLKEAKGATLEFSQSVDVSAASAGLNNKQLEDGLKRVQHLTAENEKLENVVKKSAESFQKIVLPDWLRNDKAEALFNATEQFEKLGSRALPLVADKMSELQSRGTELFYTIKEQEKKLEHLKAAAPYKAQQGGEVQKQYEAELRKEGEALNYLNNTLAQNKLAYEGAKSAFNAYNNEFKNGSKVVLEYQKDISRQLKQAGKNDEQLYIEGFREKLVNEDFLDGDQIAAEVEKVTIAYRNLQNVIRDAKLKEFLKDTFSSAFKDIITGAKGFGDTLKTVFDNFTNYVIDSSLKHLVDNFQRGFSAVASDLIQLTAVAIYSIFKDTPKNVTQSAAQQVKTPGSGAQSIADVSGRQLAYNASLPSIAEFNRNLVSTTTNLKNFAINQLAGSTIAQSIGKSVSELIGETASKFLGIGTTSSISSATYSGGQFGGLNFTRATDAVEGLGATAAKASGYLAIATLGFDLFNIANQKGVSVVNQVSQGLGAAANASTGLALAAQSLGGTFLGVASSTFGIVGAALQAISLGIDIFENGFTASNIGGVIGLVLFGALGAMIGKLIGSLFERVPNAWLNNFASDRGTALTDKRIDAGNGLWLRDTNKGGFIGIHSALGDLEFSVHEIAKFNKEDLVQSYGPLLQTHAAYNNALATSLTGVDKLFGESTVAKYNSMLWDGVSGTRLAFKQKLANLDTAKSSSEYNLAQADLLGSTGTVAGLAYQRWYQAFNKVWIEKAQGVGKDFAETTSFSIKSLLITNLSEFIDLPQQYAELFANSVKSVANGATLQEAQASATDFFNGFTIASKGLASVVPNLVGTMIPEYLAGLSKIGASVTEGATSLVALGRLIGSGFGDVFKTYYQGLTAKGYSTKDTAAFIQTSAIVGGVAKDLGFNPTTVGIDKYSESILEQAKLNTQTANEELQHAIANAKATDKYKGMSNEAIQSQLLLSGELQQSAVDATDLAKAQQPLQQAFIDSITLADSMARNLGIAVNTVTGNFDLLYAVGANLTKAFGDAKTASEVFQGALRALFSPNQLSIMSADAQSVLVDRQISNLGLNVSQETFRNYGTALFSDGNLGQLLDKSGTKLNFQGKEFDFAAALRAWQSLGVLDQLKAEAAKAPVGGGISPGQSSASNQATIDLLKNNPTYETPSTKDNNAAETAAKNLSKFNEELTKTLNLVGKNDVAKGLAEVTNYIADFQQKAIDAGGTITSEQLIALTRNKMQETFQGVVDEYNGLHQTGFQKAIADAEKFRSAWIESAEQIALKTGFTSGQIIEYANEIADARISKEVDALNASVAALGKSAAKLSNSNLTNTLLDLSDKYLEVIKSLTQNKDTTLAQYQSLVDDLKAEGNKAATEARNTVLRQYESIFQSIIDKSRSIDLNIRDKQLNSYKLIENAKLQGDLNSSDINVRIAAQQKLANLSKNVAAYQLESLMIQQRAAAEEYNKAFNPEVESKQDYINRQLKAIDTLQGLSDQFYTLQIDNAKVLVDLVNQANEKVRQLLVNPTLSILTPLQQMEEAGRQFQTALELAQSGDAESAQKVTGYADTYLNLAKTYFASTQGYSNIFKTVTDGLSGLNVKLADPQTAIASNTATTVSYLNDIKGLIANTNQIALEQKRTDLIDISTSINRAVDGFQAGLDKIADAFGVFAKVDRETGLLTIISKQQAAIDALIAQQNLTATNIQIQRGQEARDQLALQTQLTVPSASGSILDYYRQQSYNKTSTTPGMDAFLTGDLLTAYARARSSGIFSEDEIQGFSNLPYASQLQVINELKSQSRTFAKGGQTPGGYIMVGESGPELMRLDSPSYVTSRSDTERMFDNSKVVEAIINSTQQLVASNDSNTTEMLHYQREMVTKMGQLEKRMSAIESNGALVKAG